MRAFLARHLNFANLAATLALVMAVTGTASAALVITGRQVRDSTLTAADFKPGSVTSIDFSTAAKNGLRGPKGDKGASGSAGAKGSPGAQGPTGPNGAPANVRASWASWDPNYIYWADAGTNDGLADWHAWQHPSLGVCATPNCHLVAANAGNVKSLTGSAAGTSIIDLNTTAPANGFGSSAGPVTVAVQEATVMAWANVSLMYRSEDDGSPLKTRAECWMTIDGVQAGPRMLVSAFGQRQIETVAVVGNEQKGPGTYNAAVLCRDADATAGRTRWQAVRANLTIIANEKV